MPNRIRLADDDVLPLMRVTVSDLAPSVMVVGDPARAAKAAALLDGARKVGENREYVTYSGTFHGTPISVASHGVGAPGAAVVFEELCRGGVRRIVRAGTAGGIQSEVLDGSLVVATGAVRDDGVTATLVPLAYPAITDPALTMSLVREAAAQGATVHTGVVLTSACFYPLDVLANDQPMWQRAGVVAIEMELAALLVIAAQHGVAAGGILAIDGNPMVKQDTEMGDYQPFREIVVEATDRALRAALRALSVE
ncbi:MAG: nucleoside phosphorylase [Nakamurella sp.]